MTKQSKIASVAETIAKLERAKALFLGDRGRLADHETNKAWLAELQHGDLVVPCWIGAREVYETIQAQLTVCRSLHAKLTRGEP